MARIKNILCIILLIIAFLFASALVSPTWAQQNQPYGNPTSNVYARGMLSADSALRAARVKKVYPYFDSTGLLSVVGGVFYYHNGTSWITPASGGLADSMAVVRDSLAAIRAAIPSTATFVPYSGATTNLAMGTHSVTAANLSGVNTGDQTITLTSDVTGSGTGSFATTIKTNVNLSGSPTTTTQSAGDNSTKIATTGYADGAVAAITNSVTAFYVPYTGAINDLALATHSVTAANLSGVNTGDQTITLTGDVTGSGTGSFATTLKNTGTPGTYGDASHLLAVTTDAQGRVSGVSTFTIAPGGVTSVAGTANKITIAGTTSPTVTIAATYAGQSSIANLGTIVSGIWNGTPIINSFLDQSTIILNGVTMTLGGTYTVTATASGSAGGDLTGTYPNPNIKSNVALPGNPTTTTQSPADNSTKISTTAYADNAASAAIVGYVPYSGATSNLALGTHSVTAANLSGVNTGDQTIALTGDVTGSGTGSFATTIKSNVALSGSPTTTTQSPGDNSTKISTTSYADNAAAAITNTVTANYVPYSGATSNLALGTHSVTAANLSGVNTGDQTITLTGDITGSGTGSFATTAAATIVKTVKVITSGVIFTPTITATTSSNIATITLSLTPQSANTFLAGPTSGTVTATPTMRTVVLADLPSGIVAVPPDLTVSSSGGVSTIAHSALNTIADAANFVYDGNNGSTQKITLGASRTFTLANLLTGVRYVFEVVHGTSTTLTWGTTVKSAYGTAGIPPQSTPNGAIDIYYLTIDGTTVFVDYSLNMN